MPQAAPVPDIAARLDALPVTPLHGAVVVLCALGFLFDVAEAALSNGLASMTIVLAFGPKGLARRPVE